PLRRRRRPELGLLPRPRPGRTPRPVRVLQAGGGADGGPRPPGHAVGLSAGAVPALRRPRRGSGRDVRHQDVGLSTEAVGGIAATELLVLVGGDAALVDLALDDGPDLARRQPAALDLGGT